MTKSPPTNARDVRDSGVASGSGEPLEEGMATRSSTLAVDRGAWRATVQRVTMSPTRLNG